MDVNNILYLFAHVFFPQDWLKGLGLDYSGRQHVFVNSQSCTLQAIVSLIEKKVLWYTG